jgi:hypothetical protein
VSVVHEACLTLPAAPCPTGLARRWTRQRAASRALGWWYVSPLFSIGLLHSSSFAWTALRVRVNRNRDNTTRVDRSKITVLTNLMTSGLSRNLL